MRKKVYIIAGTPYQARHWIKVEGIRPCHCRVVNSERDLLLAERGSLFIKTGTFHERHDLDKLGIYLMVKDMTEYKQP